MDNFESRFQPTEPTPEISMNVSSTQKIQKRMETERKALAEGGLSFEAAKSNSDFLPDSPEVSVRNPEKIDDVILEMGRKADEVVMEGLRQELEKHGLQPDGKTFYLIDFGLPHLPALQSVLLDFGIDPSIYTTPSEETLENNAGHFRRYNAVYREHADELFRKREKLEQPKGHALLVNSHAEADERAKFTTVFPSVDTLRQSGISRIVLGKEIFYHNGVPDPKDQSWQSFFEASEVNKYAKQLSDAGFEVSVIGFDYRYKEKQDEEVPTISFGEFDPSYRPSPVEVYESSVCQSLMGKRMVFDRSTGRIYKIINGFEKPATESEVFEFSKNLLDAGLSDDEVEKMRENLSQKEKE